MPNKLGKNTIYEPVIVLLPTVKTKSQGAKLPTQLHAIKVDKDVAEKLGLKYDGNYVTRKVEVSKGNAKGAKYEIELEGGNSTHYQIHLKETVKTPNGKGKKGTITSFTRGYNLPVPAGTGIKQVVKLCSTLPTRKNIVKIVSPGGRSYHTNFK
jgi:hypothetical protein